MHIEISSLDTAEFIAPRKTHVVSLLDPGTKIPKVSVNHHVEFFHDIEGPMANFYRPQATHIANILEFIKTFSDNDNILVHCHAGVSRSTAISILIFIQHGISIEDAYEKVFRVRNCMWPNSRIIQLGDELLNCEGKLLVYHKKWQEDNKFDLGKFAQKTKKVEVDAMKNILDLFR
jgi:predicted protein tyrosine phosphatase